MSTIKKKEVKGIEPIQTPKMEHFAKIANIFQLITIFAKSSILEV